MAEKKFEVVEDMVADILRRKTPGERLRIAFGMWETAARMVRHAVRTQNPDWTDKQVRREAARRLSGGSV